MHIKMLIEGFKMEMGIFFGFVGKLFLGFKNV